MKKSIFMLFCVIAMSTATYAGGKTSCRIYGDDDNAAALSTSYCCTVPCNKKDYSQFEFLVSLEREAKSETAVFVEISYNGKTVTVRVEIPKGRSEKFVTYEVLEEKGTCANLSLSSASCR